MVRLTPAIRSLAGNEDTITIKSESSVLEESMDNSLNPDKELGDNLPRKRKRRSDVQYVDLDADDDIPEQMVKKERIDDTPKGEKARVTARVRASIIGRYQETNRRYKRELSALPNPKRAPSDKLSESYEKSMELISFMKEEYEERHAELLKLKTARTQLNAKIGSQKKALVEAKELRQKAEIRAEVFEKSSQDANMQLTLKVARPLSHAQIKLENVHEDYTSELALLRDRLAQKDADLNASEEARVAAVEAGVAVEEQLAEVRATGVLLEAPDPTQETPSLLRDLERARGLLTDSEASAAKLTITNARLEERIRELEAKAADLSDKLATARTDTANENRALSEANEKMKAEYQVLEQRAIKQKAALNNFMKDL